MFQIGKVTCWSIICVFFASLCAPATLSDYFDGRHFTPALSVRTANSTQDFQHAASRQLGSGIQSQQISNSSPPLWPYQIYKSSPFNPPVLEINSTGQPLAPGLIFITPSEGGAAVATKDIAPIILTDAGQLVWNGPAVNANNLRVATYKNVSILTYWQGLSTAGLNIGHGYGNVTFLDSTYKEILTVCPDLGLTIPGNTSFKCQADFHESYVTDRNTLLVTAYNATEADLSSVGGPSKGYVFDSLFFEIEPASGKILFRWSALEHVSISTTNQPLAKTGTALDSPFDWFHINSVVNIGDDYLVNGRHTFSTYLVNSTGAIVWTLQGETGGDFGALPPNGDFVSSFLRHRPFS